MTTTSEPYAVFRPRRSRVVATAAAVACVIAFAIVGLTVPRGGVTGWAGIDSVMLTLFGVLIAAFLMRYALVRAVPTERGLQVRNLLSTRTIEWVQVVNVQFGGGQPWLVLELDDTEHLAVMAVQRSDGPHAQAEAGRMAALVQVHSTVQDH
ncbi:PH domain-containing protein [Allobranchiibius huperziae]|uniref:Low molecular weight protein antigen 6 PH domain-containing protein n=1 Tax=Allobranchiibius huperziae TaxID=1874116 RepID=A0A853DC52_9MICO|nr:PH domain-containing protein [Allobranchiibius huperziae]NYJ74488.1 hypothetical protein [Allobranchiibius huperziae]